MFSNTLVKFFRGLALSILPEKTAQFAKIYRIRRFNSNPPRKHHPRLSHGCRVLKYGWDWMEPTYGYLNRRACLQNSFSRLENNQANSVSSTAAMTLCCICPVSAGSWDKLAAEYHTVRTFNICRNEAPFELSICEWYNVISYERIMVCEFISLFQCEKHMRITMFDRENSRFRKPPSSCSTRRNSLFAMQK